MVEAATVCEQASGCLALGHLAHGEDAAAEARRQSAAAAGAIPLVVTAMRSHTRASAIYPPPLPSPR